MDIVIHREHVLAAKEARIYVTGKLVQHGLGRYMIERYHGSVLDVGSKARVIFACGEPHLAARGVKADYFTADTQEAWHVLSRRSDEDGGIGIDNLDGVCALIIKQFSEEE